MSHFRNHGIAAYVIGIALATGCSNAPAGSGNGTSPSANKAPGSAAQTEGTSTDHSKDPQVIAMDQKVAKNVTSERGDYQSQAAPEQSALAANAGPMNADAASKYMSLMEKWSNPQTLALANDQNSLQQFINWGGYVADPGFCSGYYPNKAFVNLVYQACLNRQPLDFYCNDQISASQGAPRDPAAMYWVLQLRAGTMATQDVFNAIYNSPEAAQVGGNGGGQCVH